MQQQSENATSTMSNRTSEVICLYCKKRRQDSLTNFMACSRCMQVHYCGKECQTKDWMQHKKHCKRVGHVSTLVSNNNTKKTNDIHQAGYSLSETHVLELINEEAKNGLFLNRTNHDKIVYLFFTSCSCGYEKCVLLLLQHKADSNIHL